MIDRNGDKWIGTYSRGLVHFNDVNWTVYNSSSTGLLLGQLLCCRIDKNDALLIGTQGGLDLCYDNNITVQVREKIKKSPTQFVLYQNYPNPFNPMTLISFQLPATSFVNIEVYNLHGQKVRTLLNNRKPAGFHVVRFDGRNKNGKKLSSGIYFYRIKTDHFVQSRKLTILR